MARPRIGDVADRAGVSKTAVSFAFNQAERLNTATRDRILAAAEELGYRPSPIARRLAAQRTEQIGLALPQATHDMFANPFLPELLRGLGDVSDEEGFALVIVPPLRGSVARSVEAALVDGLVLLGMPATHPELENVRRSGLPIVALDGEDWMDVDAITIDDAVGSRAAAQHLRELGHRDVAVVLIAQHADNPIDEQHGISARRLAGVREGFGLSGDGDGAGDGTGNGSIRLRILSAPVSEDGGRAAFEALLAEGLPTAVLLMADVMAIGLMMAAADAGVRVPDELSVIGYDDIPAASWTTPRLTTVHQPIRDKGRRAARRLIEAIRSGSDHHPAVELLPTRLVVRGSTSIPRDSRTDGPPPGGGAH